MSNGLCPPCQKRIVEHESHVIFDHPQPLGGSVQRCIDNPNYGSLRHVGPSRLLSSTGRQFKLDHTAQPDLRTEYAKCGLALSSRGETSCLEPSRFRGYTFMDFAVG